MYWLMLCSNDRYRVLTMIFLPVSHSMPENSIAVNVVRALAIVFAMNEHVSRKMFA
jgi:hypothetical protein